MEHIKVFHIYECQVCERQRYTREGMINHMLNDHVNIIALPEGYINDKRNQRLL